MHAEVEAGFEVVWRETLASSGFVGGRAVADFESQWAQYCGRGHAVGVANGTDAIELSLRALGIGEGDEVLVPANTFIATPAAVVAAGAIPRFVDVDEHTLLVTASLLDAAITPSTAAVIVVHLYGQLPDMDAIAAVVDRAGLALVEDAAQAHGATWRGRRAGAFGRAGCFSFYPGKNLGALGDGGAIVTDDAALAESIRSLANHGRAESSHFAHEVVGRNSRLDGLQAGLLSVKLARLDDWNGGRREAHRLYGLGLAGSTAVQVTVADGAESVFHLEVVRTRQRDAVAAGLERRGVATGIHYPIPCHRQVGFARWADGPLPVAERTAGEILSLPMYPHLTADGVTRVCSALAEVLQEIGGSNDG